MIKAASNEVFRSYLKRVEEEASDERHNVKKGVNWALRQIGKRNADAESRRHPHRKRIQKLEARGARWIASDALRELQRWKPR
jgi:3-methyladenine DNA glycosylase AlkD